MSESRPDEQQPTAAPDESEQPEQTPAPDDGDDSSSDEPQVGRRPDFIGSEGEEGEQR